ncbi:MAG: endonuclease [Gemmatimonadetes bacterium]|nr:endonuclease [Gemmatimonadota bacterium]MYD14977.1 endonuclease [Gemmatimonadota bacterium]MYI66558.1 endonuclease [Gemmatimonadota bacterium]
MLRIATFNIENLTFEDRKNNPGVHARQDELRRVLARLRADVLCLQEVHAENLDGHTEDNPKRELGALNELLKTTIYENYHPYWTSLPDHEGVPRAKRNLVILSRFPFDSCSQYRNKWIDKLMYVPVTEKKAEEAEEGEQPNAMISWERPILHATITVDSGKQKHKLHIINLHLKSRLPSKIKGQIDEEQWWLWRSAAGWAEGYFLSSIKRVGQALETRVLLDTIFDDEPDAKVLVCGDLNAEPGEVPIEAICGRVENTGNPALRKRVMIACSEMVPESLRFTHLHHGEGNLLDHILVSKPLLAHLCCVAIHNEGLHDESLPFAVDMKYPESDHAPFVAVFDLSL